MMYENKILCIDPYMYHKQDSAPFLVQNPESDRVVP